MHNIIIADDHPFTLAGTEAFVKALGYAVVKTCNNGIVAFNLIVSMQPHIAILDVNMPGMNGIEVMEKLALMPKAHTRIVLLTMHREASIYRRAFELGLFGYILKEYAAEELQACLSCVSRGERYVSPSLKQDLQLDTAKGSIADLTFAEQKVVELIAQYKTSKQIAETLFISEKTVEGHRRNIIEKLKLPKEKNSLLIWAIQQQQQ